MTKTLILDFVINETVVCDNLSSIFEIETENLKVAREFKAGDILIFQLESGYGLLKVLAVDETSDDVIWHLAAFEDLFLDSEMAEMALENQANMRFIEKHLALTNRAFESTPTAKLINVAPTNEELQHVESWRRDANHKLNDLSVRLLLGLR